MANVNVVVGQEVGIRSGYGHGRVSFGYTVAKVTASGQVVVTRTEPSTIPGLNRERRFNADGYEMKSGASTYHRDSLVTDVAAARERARVEQACNTAANAISAVRIDARGTYGKEGLLEQVAKLETLLAAARAAVEAI